MSRLPQEYHLGRFLPELSAAVVTATMNSPERGSIDGFKRHAGTAGALISRCKELADASWARA
jgi:hypothetical protein